MHLSDVEMREVLSTAGTDQRLYFFVDKIGVWVECRALTKAESEKVSSARVQKRVGKK